MIQPKFKLAVFDLDGTILNSLDDLAAATNVALRANGFPPRTREEVQAFVGNGISRLIALAVPAGTDEKRQEAVRRDFMAYYHAHCACHSKPYPGIVELLESLRQMGVFTAILSNKEHGLTTLLGETYFKGLFHTVWGEREKDGIPKKPSPAALFAMMREYGVTQAETVYIGDSDVDVKTAAAAGVSALLCDWGLRTREQLLAAGATTIVSSAKELLETLRQ